MASDTTSNQLPEPPAASGKTEWRRRSVVWLQQHRGRLLLVAALLVLAGYSLWRLGWSGGVINGLFPYASEARIYVEPPQVYTRERLVNDRFRELNWLESRLELLESTADRAPSQRSSRTIERGLLALRDTDGADVSRSGTVQTSTPGQGALDQNDAFDLDFQRRLAVRAEIMNTLLDDGHDLAGSTLYRLNFDVSIIPRRHATGFGLVAIDVLGSGCEHPAGREACDETQDQVRSYRTLLGDWERELQGFLSKVYRNRITPSPDDLYQVIDPFKGGAAPKERMAFNWYLKAQTIETFLDLVAGANDPDCEEGSKDWQCDAAWRRDAARKALGWPGSTERLAGDLSPRLEQAFGREIQRFVAAVREAIDAGQLQQFLGRFNSVRALCRRYLREEDAAVCDEIDSPPKVASRGCAEGLLRDLRQAGIRIPDESRGVIEYFACGPPPIEPGASASGASASRLVSEIMGSSGCLTGSANPGWDKYRQQRTTVRCPQGIRPEVANLHGLVQLAGRLERVRSVLLASGTDGPVIPFLPQEETEAAAVPRIGRVGLLYACLVKSGLLMPETVEPISEQVESACAALVSAPASAAPDIGKRVVDRIRRANLRGEPRVDPKAFIDASPLLPGNQVPQLKVRFVQPLLDDAARVPSQAGSTGGPRPPTFIDHTSIRMLFEKKFADFFVDRLRRNDIPGYQPSPPIDRFFSIRTTGCEAGDCDVMLSRKRWLDKDVYQSVGGALEARLSGCRIKGPGWFQRLVEGLTGGTGASGSCELEDPDACRSQLRTLLQVTYRKCASDAEAARCHALLRAALGAAKSTAAGRQVLRSAGAVSAAESFKRELGPQYHLFRCCPRPKVPAGEVRACAVGSGCRDCAQRPPELGTEELAIVGDFVDTVTALEFRRALGLLGGPANVKVYAVEPRSRGIKSQDEIRRSERLRASLQAGGELFSGAELAGINDAFQTLERVSARNTIIGFGHLRGEARPAAAPDRGAGRSRGAAPMATFGWMFLPNRFEPKGWLGTERETHQPGAYRLSAVLSVPSWWTDLRLQVRQCWGHFGRVHQSVMSDPYAGQAKCDGAKFHNGLAPAGRTEHLVELPASTDRITEEFEFEVIKVPNINERDPSAIAEVEAGRRDQRLVIEGQRLWRGTMVTLGDQRADEIIVLPDMRGVVARFDCVLPPPGRHHFMPEEIGREGSEAPPDPIYAPMFRKVTVWTAQGHASTTARIWPFKQRTQGEKPCWLDASAPSQTAEKKKPDVSGVEVKLTVSGEPVTGEPGKDSPKQD
ncbi:MAG: hypothetical protein N838_28040 [Thiohalocapsa sp. PB-PSB1]|jgi:hypothetical protein|nr:MAG: hypothetical protein N838_28040 [Thiohalocapsa sp. PB-PSB1]